MCMVGGIRNSVMFRDFGLISASWPILIAVIIGNLILGKFNLGFEGQPIAHTDGVWNFLGMALVGWLSVLLGGCPLRQLVLSGEGNSDAAMAVLGMLGRQLPSAITLAWPPLPMALPPMVRSPLSSAWWWSLPSR